MMDQNLDVVDVIISLLGSEKYQEAVAVPNDEKYAEYFRNSCWDVMTMVLNMIKDDTIVIKPSLFRACEELLLHTIQKSIPEEALLELIEKVEEAKNEAQLSLFLPPLQQLLKQLSIKRGRSLEWSLDSIFHYIESIPTTNLGLEGRERILMDSDKNVRRITRVYSLLPSFYGAFIEELNEPDSSVKTKQIISTFLISLLGKPLIYVDLDPQNNDGSEIRQVCGILINDICKLEKNVFKFFPYVELSYRESLKTKTRKVSDRGVEKLPYENEEKINITTLSGFYYFILSGHFEIPNFSIPQVYLPEYVTHTVMLCVIHLLSFTQYGPLDKANHLGKALLKHIPENQTHEMLSSQVHFDLCKSLMNVAVYCDYEPIRRETINLIGGHIRKFDFKGRSILIKYILETSNHSGMIGYAIILFKNAINEAFLNPELPDCFTGLQFFNMVKKICYLPHGAESDLIELADQIITSLNFLRYLALKDSDNRTGIKDFFTLIESDYLDTLRVALNMSKAHYEAKLRDLKQNVNQPQQNVDLTVTVGGHLLDGVPLENQKEIIDSALNAFHLIEGLVARLSECISINRMLP